MKKSSTSDPTIVIWYDENELERIRMIEFSAKDLLGEIGRNSQNCNYHTTDCEELWVTYDWSTGLEFDDHHGGGYYINFEEDWYNGKILLSVYAEWHDTWSEENGYEKCKDESRQLQDALVEVERFIKRI